MAATFPPIVPEHSVEEEVNSLRKFTMLGDGNEASAAMGLNPTRPSWKLTWGVNAHDASRIETFLSARAADGQPFLWTAPGEPEALKWKCPEWTRDQVSGGWFRVTATFNACYEPDEYILFKSSNQYIDDSLCESDYGPDYYEADCFQLCGLNQPFDTVNDITASYQDYDGSFYVVRSNPTQYGAIVSKAINTGTTIQEIWTRYYKSDQNMAISGALQKGQLVFDEYNGLWVVFNVQNGSTGFAFIYLVKINKSDGSMQEYHSYQYPDTSFGGYGIQTVRYDKGEWFISGSQAGGTVSLGFVLNIKKDFSVGWGAQFDARYQGQPRPGSAGPMTLTHDHVVISVNGFNSNIWGSAYIKLDKLSGYATYASPRYLVSGLGMTGYAHIFSDSDQSVYVVAGYNIFAIGPYEGGNIHIMKFDKNNQEEWVKGFYTTGTYGKQESCESTGNGTVASVITANDRIFLCTQIHYDYEVNYTKVSEITKTGIQKQIGLIQPVSNFKNSTGPLVKTAESAQNGKGLLLRTNKGYHIDFSMEMKDWIIPAKDTGGGSYRMNRIQAVDSIDIKLINEVNVGSTVSNYSVFTQSSSQVFAEAPPTPTFIGAIGIKKV